MNEEEKKAVEDSKDLIKVFNNYKDKDFIDRLYYKNEPIEENLKILLNLIEKLQKENEELKSKNKTLEELLQGNLYELYKYYKELAGTYQGNCISVQKVKDKIEEVQKEYNKLDKQVDEYINDANKDLSKYYENKEKIGTMQTLAWVIDNLQELLEGRKYNEC
nr:MAG TPA: Vps53-like protein [Caudoviricetes sp.]